MQDHFGKIPLSPSTAFPSKAVVHCAEFIPTGPLFIVKKKVYVVTLGTARFTIWQGLFPHTAGIAWQVPSTACIPLKYSSCTWTAEFMQAAEISLECAPLTMQKAVPAARNTSGAMGTHCKSISLTRKLGVVIGKPHKCKTRNQIFKTYIFNVTY